MIWSFSNHRMFHKCQRQWYFKNVLANAVAKDPVRKEAQRLSKLCSISAWRGRIVDAAISERLVPGLNSKRTPTQDQLKNDAHARFERQRAAVISGAPTGDDGFGGFFEIEYGLPLTDSMYERTLREIDESIAGLYKNTDIRSLLKSASRVIAQRAFTYGNIELIEAQLLTGEIRRHRVTEEDELELQDLVATSATDMLLLRGEEDAKTTDRTEFAVTLNPKNCEQCPFKKMCWEGDGK